MEEINNIKEKLLQLQNDNMRIMDKLIQIENVCHTILSDQVSRISKLEEKLYHLVISSDKK